MASDKPTHHDEKDEKVRHEAALAQAHAAEKAAAEDKRAAAAPLTPAGINLLIALLAADWVVGDKHHYALIRKQTLKLLGDLGADGAEAKARLEGMSGGSLALVPPPVAKAA
jgi:hypothetical protein